mgnify:CR=1 FL=1
MVEWIKLAGLSDYAKTIDIMEQKLHNVIEHNAPETIFLLEHEDVYTAGTSYNDNELLATNDIPVIYSRRGGRFTYHGQGQRVIYPILDLRNREQDLKLYVRNLESWIINSLRRLGVKAYTIKDMVGIWVNSNNQPAKIGAIGVRVKKWVTYHGIAVNINTNLKNYEGIVPCGISDFPVTSLKEVGIKVQMQDFDIILKEEFGKIF